VLLAVDVGNTSSVIGLFDGDALAAEWRIATRYRTTDELDVTLRGLLASRAIDAGRRSAAAACRRRCRRCRGRGRRCSSAWRARRRW